MKKYGLFFFRIKPRDKKFFISYKNKKIFRSPKSAKLHLENPRKSSVVWAACYQEMKLRSLWPRPSARGIKSPSTSTSFRAATSFSSSTRRTSSQPQSQKCCSQTRSGNDTHLLNSRINKHFYTAQKFLLAAFQSVWLSKFPLLYTSKYVRYCKFLVSVHEYVCKIYILLLCLNKAAFLSLINSLFTIIRHYRIII